MSRPPRFQPPGGVFHLINRGNYRRDVFESNDAKWAFEQCLIEACERFRWSLYAYALMRNHFHLVARIAEANLAQGMHWLQGTFAARFNHFRHEKGYLFQNRYQAILCQPGHAVLRKVDYVHLNPVRAQIVSLGELRDYLFCSYRRYLVGPRWPFLDASPWLSTLGLNDSNEGWDVYQAHLAAILTNSGDPTLGVAPLISTGSALGTQDWLNRLQNEAAEDLAPFQSFRAPTIAGKEAGWEQAIAKHLELRQITPDLIQKTPKSAAWKVEIAERMLRQSGATIVWLAQRLNMGAASSARVYLCNARS